jgi:AcrR family transcriptional regulator
VARPSDPELEGKILEAAGKLWRKGGAGSLTMRAVARAAGTNTPAVYRRFRDRDDLLRGMLRRVRLEIAAELERAATVEEACEKYLEYALEHPWDYELFYQHNYELDHSPRVSEQVARPARAVMQGKLQGRLGGSEKSRETMLTALWMLGHGAAMLLIDKSIPPKEAPEARKVFSAAVKALMKEAEFLSKLKL